ncbi:MAG: M1 family metallopeptidase [Bacteroidetes bacterium]|jgi:leukotriene-A4 hydrolase|nr:M1 family metallopeptidase [Bacteroidota bacterium]MDA0981223.1 M1 family metallopeptidase [Bacteroidota bacterium]
MNLLKISLITMGLVTVASCENATTSTSSDSSSTKKEAILKMKRATDHHSYSKPAEAVVTHLDWNAVVDFESRTIAATATFDLETSDHAEKVILDIRELDILSVQVDGKDSPFNIGEEQEFIGSPLSIEITPLTKKVSITYNTQPGADAFLWVEGSEDANPFLFTQSQAILARTWIPCQDSPGIRFTYNATVDVPKDLMALMSAVNPTEKNAEGHYTFVMDQPIPSYLLALAVGDVEFRSVGAHTGVYATPDLIDAAEYEFAEMEDLLIAAENLYGKYAWERYDLLVLPAAFPFGGMENPRLTFATPTIIAGDRSLVSLVAHELAHSWSGNLVTNSTWDDFWLNEGFTVYFEQRIMEAVYGRDISEMLASLSYRGLVNELSDLSPNDTHLRLHLKGRNPDDGMTAIAYDKGFLFLRMIEETVGRAQFDAFLSEYFTKHAFTVMDTDNFIEYLEGTLLTDETTRDAVNLTAWIDGAGLPENCPKIQSDRIENVDIAVASWASGELATSDLLWNDWLYQERYRFLKSIPSSVNVTKLDELNSTFKISSTGNNEVLFAWLEQAVLKGHEASYDRLETFLINVGRRKFLTPLYKALLDTDQTNMALSIYKKARPNYHSVATGTMDELLNIDGGE